MAVYIYQPDALDKLAAVEGAAWAQEQQARQHNPHGFYAFLKEWLWLQAELDPDEVWEDNLWPNNGDGAIYGKEGYSRYVVRGDGEIVLLGWSTRPERIKRAQQVGFRVSG